MKNSKEKYVICSQKDLYKTDLRRIPGVPLIYFNRSVLTLDTPSKNSQHAVDHTLMTKLGMTKGEKKEIGIRKEKREERSYVTLCFRFLRVRTRWLIFTIIRRIQTRFL